MFGPRFYTITFISARIQQQFSYVCMELLP